MKLKLPILLAFSLLLQLPLVSHATHLRGGEITIKQLSCASYQYEVTLTIYTNTATTATPGGGTLEFGDGTGVFLPDVVSTMLDAPYAIGVAVFKQIHVYEVSGTYLLRYSEGNRNAGILNMTNSVNVPFYTETLLRIDPIIPCNHPIGFSIPPVDKACKGIIFTHNPGAFDIDGDSLAYEMVPPKNAPNRVVTGFLMPNNNSFYAGINFQQANEAKNGPPLFDIDPVTGTLTWDAPGMVGQYEITFKVTEWKKFSGSWFNMGYVIRDMQIIVEDCQDTRPVLKMPKDICVSPGDKVSEIIRAFDAEFNNVKIEVFTTDNFFSSVPHYKNQNVFQSTKQPSDTANLRFIWDVTCDHVREQPYTIIFKVTDQPFAGVKLSTFYTWTITVLGGPPKFTGITLNAATKTLRVEWNPYPCQNAKVIEVWRRTGKAPYTQENCRRGIPRALGFTRIGLVTNSNFFLDTDVSPGAEYCYRLVAEFDSPKSLSIVSNESCVGPLLIDAPVITNVSVIKTDSLDGKILVRWTSPIEINRANFPPPYEYDLYRTDTKNNVFVRVGDHRLTDTTYVDAGLNPVKRTYGYRVVVYSPTGISQQNPLDTSGLAYNPRLAASPKPGNVYLQWDAVVPWTNQSTQYPYHHIYRKEVGKAFELIDSVDVNTLTIDVGFEYLDQGKFKGRKLEENTVYVYQVSTTGVYGNPKIKEPLINFSNEVRAQPIDKTPPCQPTLALGEFSCDNFRSNYACDFVDFQNTLTWEYPTTCGDDIAIFEVWYSQTKKTEDFVLLITTREYSYVHKKQDSFLGCYKIRAVDYTGNIGAESDVMCAENCPSIFIPNVFTPANKDGLNDFFPGITRMDYSKTDPAKCPRFVKSMDIQIFNRFGQEVYEANELIQKPNLEWVGMDTNGKELPSGIYYYSANVHYDTLDPAQQVQIVKGWVNLIR